MVDYYREQNDILLKSLIETNINMNISIFYEKQDSYKAIKELTYHIGNVGVELKEGNENREDIELAAFTYNDAKYIRKEIQINNEDIYYLYIYINLYADNIKDLEYYLNKIEGIAQSKGMQTRRANFRQEEIFLATLPISENREIIKNAARRNILTSGLLSTYPFISSTIFDPNGIFIGTNIYNNSLVFIDRYNTEKYKNANICIFGTSGAGKSFYSKLLILRYKLLGISQYIVDPEREYNSLCKELHGIQVKIGPNSNTYINILEIRKESIEDGEKGYLATKISKLIGFFNLIFGELNEDEKAIIEEKLIETYKRKNITFNDNSLYKQDPEKIIGKIFKQLGKIFSKLEKFFKELKGTSKFFDKTTKKFILDCVIAIVFVIIILLIFHEDLVFTAVLETAIVVIFIFRLLKAIADYDKIEEKLKEMYEGNNTDTLERKEFLPEFYQSVDYINDISNGFERAIQDRIKSERLKTELITNVSHDIKTPLTSIINYVDLLKKEDIRNEKANEYIEILDSKSQRLKKLIEDLVEASKVSTGNVKLQIEKINIVELLNQAIGEFEDKFEAKKLEILLEAKESEIYILADSRYMYRIVENLFSNISKYALENSRVYIDIIKKSNEVYIEMKNISKEKLNISAEELMQRFVRGDKSRTTEGSGLGISIAQNLTEIQKGVFNLKLDGDLFRVELIFNIL